MEPSRKLSFLVRSFICLYSLSKLDQNPGGDCCLTAPHVRKKDTSYRRTVGNRRVQIRGSRGCPVVASELRGDAVVSAWRCDSTSSGPIRNIRMPVNPFQPPCEVFPRHPLIVEGAVIHV